MARGLRVLVQAPRLSGTGEAAAKVGAGGTASAAHWRHTAGQIAAIIRNQDKQANDWKGLIRLRYVIVNCC